MADEPKKRLGRPKTHTERQARLVANIDGVLADSFRDKAFELGRIQRHCLEEALRDWLLKYGDGGLLK